MLYFKGVIVRKGPSIVSSHNDYFQTNGKGSRPALLLLLFQTDTVLRPGALVHKNKKADEIRNG